MVSKADLTSPETIEKVAHAVARSLNLSYWSGTEEQAELLCTDIAKAVLSVVEEELC